MIIIKEIEQKLETGPEEMTKLLQSHDYILTQEILVTIEQRKWDRFSF